jgi:Protein of unknown function (DUF3891)
MVLRRDSRGVLAIGQPSHAWVSGQLARAWGNTRFGRVEPADEVCLAADQHDIGMAAWDLEPTYNEATGLPDSFMEMPPEEHLRLWRAGPTRLLAQSRYAALLVSMHGWRLYEQRDLARLTDDQAAEVGAFLSEQREFQEQLLGTLRSDPTTEGAAQEEVVTRNSQLIWTWDFLSLALCLDWAPCIAAAVPTAEDPVELRITPGRQPDAIVIDPWPLGPDELTVRCEGRRLNGRWPTAGAMRQALDDAPWETLELRLIPT